MAEFIQCPHCHDYSLLEGCVFVHIKGGASYSGRSICNHCKGVFNYEIRINVKRIKAVRRPNIIKQDDNNG